MNAPDNPSPPRHDWHRVELVGEWLEHDLDADGGFVQLDDAIVRHIADPTDTQAMLPGPSSFNAKSPVCRRPGRNRIVVGVEDYRGAWECAPRSVPDDPGKRDAALRPRRRSHTDGCYEAGDNDESRHQCTPFTDRFATSWLQDRSKRSLGLSALIRPIRGIRVPDQLTFLKKKRASNIETRLPVCRLPVARYSSRRA